MCACFVYVCVCEHVLTASPDSFARALSNLNRSASDMPALGLRDSVGGAELTEAEERAKEPTIVRLKNILNCMYYRDN